MSFIQLQPVRKTGKTYVNLAWTVREAGRRHPRQKRIYLGALMADGATVRVTKAIAASRKVEVALEELRQLAARGEDLTKALAERSAASWREARAGSVRTVEVLGPMHALGHYAADIGLDRCLAAAFGEEDGKHLLLLAIHQAAEARPLYLAQGWLEEAGAPEWERLSSPETSRLMARAGADGSGQERFFRAWIEANGRPKSLVLDSTSISSRSENLELAEYGYNRDGEDLPQINLAMARGGKRGLPVYCRTLPGSIPDVATLQVTTETLRDYGIKQFTAALDRGFYSEANLLGLAASGLGFVIGVPFTVGQAQGLLRRHRAALASPKRSICFNGQAVRAATDRWVAGRGNRQAELSAHLYFIPERRGQQEASLERRVFELERLGNRKLADGSLGSPAAARQWLRESSRGLWRCLGVLGTGNDCRIVRKPRVIAQLAATKGYTLVLASDRQATAAEVLADYRSRDAVEKLFDALKNENGQSRLRSGDETVMQGRILLAFCAVTLRLALEQGMRDCDLLSDCSVAELLQSLRKFRAARTATGRRFLLEAPRKSRDMLLRLSIPLPK